MDTRVVGLFAGLTNAQKKKPRRIRALDYQSAEDERIAQRSPRSPSHPYARASGPPLRSVVPLASLATPNPARVPTLLTPSIKKPAFAGLFIGGDEGITLRGYLIVMHSCFFTVYRFGYAVMRRGSPKFGSQGSAQQPVWECEQVATRTL